MCVCGFFTAPCNKRHMHIRVWHKRSCIYRTQLSVTEIPLKLHAAAESKVKCRNDRLMYIVSLDGVKLNNHPAALPKFTMFLGCSAIFVDEN